MITKIKNFFLAFSVIFFIAAVSSFTAYNWKAMTNFQKLTIPSILIIAGLTKYIFFKKDIYKNLSLFFACFMVGTLFAVFGQVYQTGADSWILFRNWAFFLIVPTLLTMSYPLFLLLITVLSFMTFFYLGLYYKFQIAFFIATLIAGLVVGLYPILCNKFKLNFNNYFYSSLVIPFYILFNIAGVIIIFSNASYLGIDKGMISILSLLYPIIIGVLFLVAYKIGKKYIILPFSILSTGLFAWSWLTYNLFKGYLDEPTGFFLLSLIIFIGTFTALVKTIPPLENDFIVKIVRAIGNFLKFFISLSGIGLILSWIILSSMEYTGFLIVGIILLIFSCFSPKMLNFKEDKLEIISFGIGLFSLTYFLDQTLSNPETIILATFMIIVFDVFWFIRSNKAMDLLFAPAHYAYLLVLLDKFNPNFSFGYDLFSLNPHFITIFAILIIPLQLIFSKKIALSAYKDKINRIFYGSNISLLIFLLFRNSDFVVYPYYDQNIYEHFTKILSYIGITRNILITAISIFIAVFSLSNKRKLAISDNSEIKDEEDYKLKDIIIFSILILIIQYFSWYIDGVNIIILLILLYTYKRYKWTTYLLNIVLTFRIFYYYYSIFHITLLKKSIYMSIIGLALVVAYLVLKYFVKEAAINENKN